MWALVWFFLGSCRVKITGASPQWALNRLAQERIAFRRVERRDAFTIELRLRLRDVQRAKAASERAMCQLTADRQFGFLHCLGAAAKRPLLLILLALAAAAAVIVPKFVFFYEVTGNERVPSALILRTLDELGVGVGTFGPSIKPQAIKNRLLCRIPELKWVTIQQSGMRATVVVREREEKEPVYSRKQPRNIVASRAGLLTRVQVLAGNALCTPGQSVAQGELLVSAYTDFGYKMQVSSASAEIYARTWYKSRCLTPQTELLKCPTGNTHRQISLRVGRRRWTLFGAEQTTTDCDKQTKYHQFMLPGGIFLPLGIEITEISDYDTEQRETDEARARERLTAFARRQLLGQMIAGEILDESVVLCSTGGAYEQYTRFTCEEMIARSVDAEIFKDD